MQLLPRLVPASPGRSPCTGAPVPCAARHCRPASWSARGGSPDLHFSISSSISHPFRGNNQLEAPGLSQGHWPCLSLTKLSFLSQGMGASFSLQGDMAKDLNEGLIREEPIDPQMGCSRWEDKQWATLLHLLVKWGKRILRRLSAM